MGQRQQHCVTREGLQSCLISTNLTLILRDLSIHTSRTVLASLRRAPRYSHYASRKVEALQDIEVYRDLRASQQVEIYRKRRSLPRRRSLKDS